MDFSLLDQSKSSCEETDQITDEIVDTAAARSYGCIFCKRGFTTAQALGGHMNIHRKDRSTTKPNPSSSSSSSSSSSYVPPLMSDELTTYVSLHSNYYYPPCPPFYHPSNYSSAPEPYIGLPISAKTSYYSFPSQVEQFPSSLQADEDRLNWGFSDEGLVWGQTLNLHGGPLLRVSDDHGVEERRAVISDEEDVDLELRLGYA